MGRVVARSLREELIRMVCEHMPINYMVDVLVVLDVQRSEERRVLLVT